MRIITSISVHGLRNVHDHEIYLPDGLDHLVLTGFNGTGKTSILNAIATHADNSVSISSVADDFTVLVWDRENPSACVSQLEKLVSAPVVLFVDDAQIGLDPQKQRQFFPNLIAEFPNVQILASTSSPFILMDMKNTAVYNLDTRRLHPNPYAMTYEEIGQKAFGV